MVSYSYSYFLIAMFIVCPILHSVQQCPLRLNNSPMSSSLHIRQLCSRPVMFTSFVPFVDCPSLAKICFYDILYSLNNHRAEDNFLIISFVCLFVLFCFVLFCFLPACPSLYQPSVPSSSSTCQYTNGCLGIVCCVNANLGFISRSVKLSIAIDPCNFALSLTFENWGLNMSLVA